MFAIIRNIVYFAFVFFSEETVIWIKLRYDISKLTQHCYSSCKTNGSYIVVTSELTTQPYIFVDSIPFIDLSGDILPAGHY